MEISLEYWNTMAQQIVLISSLLGGFSISVIASLLAYESKNRFVEYTLKFATVAAGSFLACLFCWTDVIMVTTEGYPTPTGQSDIAISKSIGLITFFLGIVSLCLVISFAGWIKSKSMGRFTSIVGFVTFLIIFIAMSKVG